MKQLLSLACACTLLASCSDSTGPKGNQEIQVEDNAALEVSGKYADNAPLEIEELGAIEVLPEGQYSESWIFAHNTNFYSLLDGNIVLIDAAADTKEYKGMITAAQLGVLTQAPGRGELYVAETFQSRGTRGQETDVLTVYDAKSLEIIDELILPGGKRAQTVTQKGSFQIIDNERLGLVYNFTPASSVTVVDLENREIVTEIPIPGCGLTFPLQGAAFGTLCGNGTMSSFDVSGDEINETRSEAFNDIDNDAMFLKSTVVDDVRYFPTFTGNVRPIDVGGSVAQPLPDWSLVSDTQRAANWRPSGWQVITSDDAGLIYVLMDKGVIEGGHKSGGSEVWVFDPKTQKRTSEIALENGGLSIEMTGGSNGLLVVTNAEMKLDVYSRGGELQRTITVNDTATPFVLYAAE